MSASPPWVCQGCCCWATHGPLRCQYALLMLICPSGHDLMPKHVSVSPAGAASRCGWHHTRWLVVVSAALCLTGHLLLQVPVDRPSSEQQRYECQQENMDNVCILQDGHIQQAQLPALHFCLGSGMREASRHSPDTVTVSIDCGLQLLLCLLRRSVKHGGSTGPTK